MRICAELWEALEKIVKRTSPNTSTYDYYVEIPARGARPSAQLQDYLGVLTTFLEGRHASLAGGRPVQMRMMDVAYKSPSGASAVLLYAGKKDPLNADETLDLIYGMYFWAFTYGIEIKTLAGLRDQARKYARLKDDVLRQCTDGVIPLVGMTSTAAQRRGLVWPRLHDV
jgi:hypothetical protein